MSMVESTEARRRKKSVKTSPEEFSGEETLVENHTKREDATTTKEKRKLIAKKSIDFTSTKRSTVAGYKYRWLVFFVLTALSFYTRLRKLKIPNFVTWDEAHFGKFASNYIKRDFFFDLHPPGGKILLAIPGILAGYNGNSTFESGSEYTADVPYVAMRAFTGVLGALIVPVVYGTMLSYGTSVWSAAFAAFLILCDMIFITITRYILLDSPLLIFTALSMFTFVNYHKANQRQPFSLKWWAWLIATGFSMGMVISVKWIGFFIVAFIGVQTILDLWYMLGDKQVPLTHIIKSFIARAICLIAIPLAIYMAWIYVHFTILNTSNSSSSSMSSLFQLRLKGQEFDKNPLQIAYGSVITLKNNAFNGGLLHSHQHHYPEGSKQQQITTYHYNDDNNKWIVRKGRLLEAVNETYETGEIQYVKEGDIIRLVHQPTKCYLHSHHHPAPITNAANEVSCYGRHSIDGFSDDNDEWQLLFDHELLQKKGAPRTLQALSSYIILKHTVVGCYLRSSNEHLPEWAYKQGEVICDKVKRTDKNSIWNVELNENKRLPAIGNISKMLRNIGFFHNFLDLNVAMWRSNKGLSPDPNKLDELASVPSDWPLARRGIRMTGWEETKPRVWMMGNIVIWASGFIIVLMYLAVAGFFIIRRHRHIHDLTNEQWDKFCDLGTMFVMAWILHYIPFFLVGRVMYLHHYVPAAMFLPMLLAATIDFIFDVIPKNQMNVTIRYSVMFLFSLAVFTVFWIFRYIPYGMMYPVQQMAKYRFRSSWNIV